MNIGNSIGDVTLSFGGDMMCMGAETAAVQKKYGRLDYDSYLEGLVPVFANSDYVAVNLETPIDDSQPLTNAAIRFNTSSEFLKSIKKIGVDFVSTANNHCLDRGVAGMLATLDAVDAVGFDHDGTFRCAADADKIFVKEICGVRIAIVASTFGTNSQINGVLLPSDEMWRVALLRTQPKLRRTVNVNLDGGIFSTYIADECLPVAITNHANQMLLDRVLAKVRRAKSLADIVIAMPHVGGQYNPGPAAYAKYIVDQMISAGSDIVIAGHPHVPHYCEQRSGAFVCWSLGNLSFTPNVGFFVRNVLSEYGVVLHLHINSQMKNFEYATFDVVKNVVDDDGCTHTVPVQQLLESEKNAAHCDRLQMEYEAIVRRFM